MNEDDLQKTWVRQAQADAEQGVIQCRMCRRRSDLDEAVTLWRNGDLLFAVCDRCASFHDLVMRPSIRGIEIRAKARSPIVIRGDAL